MKTTEIHKKINGLLSAFSDGENEYHLRNSAQTLMLLIQTDDSLKTNEREYLISELRKAVRPLARFDCKNGNDVCEMNSLLGELCLAASFYLLENQKRLRLYEADNDTFVKINKRSFENCFFYTVSLLLKTNSEISVEIKSSGEYCCVLISADSSDVFNSYNLLPNSFTVYEDGMESVSLNLKTCSQIPDSFDYEDFSLLLFDSLSPMQVWLCDI